MSMRKTHRCFGVVMFFVMALLLAGCSQGNTASTDGQGISQGGEPTAVETAAIEQDDSEGVVDLAAYGHPGQDYTLKKVVVLGRHNIRAPLSSGGSTLALATPHEWIRWTSEPSGLTLRGGALETMLGQYVRQWLEAEGLIERDWQPTEGEVRFYANSLQRTHATARYFSSGMLPVGDAEVETHYALNELDPVFIPYVTFTSPSYEEAVIAQIAERGGDDGMAGVAADLADNFELLADVCDYTESEGYQSGELKDFDVTDTQVFLKVGEEPSMTGSLKTATSLADALVLQYYEADDEHAAFGKALTEEQWQQLSEIKDTYIDILFATPLIATNVAHPLLVEIGNEMDQPERLFTFLCGHDSDISSVLAALQAEDYTLPGAIESKTPIGSMVVFEQWEDAEGQGFGRVRLMYQSVDQLRNCTLLTGDEHPCVVELDFAGLEKNDEGLYALDDLRGRVQQAADAYDELVETYGDDAGLAEAA